MDNALAQLGLDFSRALDRLSERLARAGETFKLTRYGITQIQDGELIYYRVYIGEGHYGATDLIDHDVVIQTQMRYGVEGAAWDMIVERLMARLANVTKGKDHAYSQRAWDAETKGRFTPDTPIGNPVRRIIISPETRGEVITSEWKTADLVIVLMGPRPPTWVYNDKTGHRFSLMHPIPDKAKVEIDVAKKMVTLFALTTTGEYVSPLSLYSYFMVPTRQLLRPDHPEYREAWFALCKGTQTIVLGEIVDGEKVDFAAIAAESAMREA